MTGNPPERVPNRQYPMRRWLQLFRPVVLSGVLAACSGGTASTTPGAAAISQTNPVQNYDIVVYGATPSGIAAAIQAARLGKSVMLIESSHWLGGMVAGGLSETDSGTWQVIGGIALEFFQNTTILELPRGGWPLLAPGEIIFNVEPHIAQQVFNSMLQQANVSYRLDSPLVGVAKTGTLLTSIQLSDGSEYAAKVFIDSGYEGDLMAMAGVPYAIGREAMSVLEPDAGVQVPTLVSNGIGAYDTPDDASSGLLFQVTDGPAAPVGSADTHIMAYNYRICLTDLASHAANAVALSQMMPASYSAQTFAGVQRLIDSLAPYETGEAIARNFFDPPTVSGVLRPYADGKFDMNGGGPAFSSDVVHLPDQYPDGALSVRQQIAAQIRSFDQGLLYFLATDPNVPATVQQFMNQFGVCKDEFTDNGNFPTQLYQREGRRMQGAYFMTEADVLNKAASAPSDVIAWGGYNMDSHTHQILNIGGELYSEGSVDAVIGYGCSPSASCTIQPGTPFAIPYEALTPSSTDTTNLLVSVTMSASSMAYRAIRLEPQYMMMGQAAGAAASLAIDGQVAVQNISYSQLKTLLLNPTPASQPPEVLTPSCLLKSVLYPSSTVLTMYEATSTPGTCYTQTFTCENGSWGNGAVSLVPFYPSCAAAQAAGADVKRRPAISHVR
jgi:FAD dependent oxidoreductase